MTTTPAGVLRRARDQATTARHLLWAQSGREPCCWGPARPPCSFSMQCGRARPEDSADHRTGLGCCSRWAAGPGRRTRSRRLAEEAARCDAMLAELGEAEET